MKKTIILSLIAFLVACLSVFSLYALTSNSSRRKPMQLPETQQADATQVKKSKIQIALILDTSNSMDGLIDQAKAQLWKLVSELAQAKKDSTDVQIELALYQYGNDYLSIRNGYVQQILSFGTDLDMLSEKLFSLKTNGGSEYCGYAIHSSLNELDWDSDTSSLRMIYIAGNEPFTQGPVSYQTACKKAIEKQVVVNTIYCGDYQSGLDEMWSEGASCNGGSYMNIDSDKQVVYVSTPYDQHIQNLNLRLNATYIYYGKKGKSYKDNQIRQDNNASKYGAANSAQRVLSKSNKVYSNAHWDLVDAFQSDSTILDDLDKRTLPDSLQEVTPVELEKIVLANSLKRAEIQDSITSLGIKREQYIAKERSQNEGTLGDGLVKSVHRQARGKGFKFN
jgi:hypothetical protein